jgi:hypothetical protein
VAGLRQEWEAIRKDARSLQPAKLPSRAAIAGLWTDLKAESARQDRSIFETSSMLALSAARSLPDRMRWLSASARVSATRTGRVVGSALLDHYRQTLADVRDVGYMTYADRHLRPYVATAARQFSPGRGTLTERVLNRLGERRRELRRKPR